MRAPQPFAHNFPLSDHPSNDTGENGPCKDGPVGVHTGGYPETGGAWTESADLSVKLEIWDMGRLGDLIKLRGSETRVYQSAGFNSNSSLAEIQTALNATVAEQMIRVEAAANNSLWGEHDQNINEVT